MIKIILLIVGGIVLLSALAAGGIAGAFATGALEVPEVEEVSNSWGEVDQDQTEVLTSIGINNPNSISFGLDNISIAANVFLNDVQIAEGRTNGVALPEGRGSIDLVTLIDNATIADWWPTHIENGEQTEVRISPVGEVSLLAWSFAVPGPGFTQEFDTDLLEAANSDEEEEVNFGGGFGVTIKSREFGWGDVDNETTDIDGIITIHNGTPGPIPISRMDFEFTMNGIIVGQGSTEDPAVLEPGQDTPVPVSLSITNARLIEWWPTHVEGGELTQYNIDVDADVTVPILPIPNQDMTVPLLRTEDTFETNIMGG